MKYLLILHMCSFLTQTCPGMIHPQGMYDSWKDCANAGYELAGKMMKKMPENEINQHKLAIKFECMEVRDGTPL